MAAQDVAVALEMEQLVEMLGPGVGEDRVLQVIDAFLELLEQREVRVDHLIDDRVEEEVGTVREQAAVARQALADVLDGVHRLFVNGEEKVLAEECGEVVGMRAVYAEVDVDGAEDEEVVGRERIVFRQRVRRERVFRRQLVEPEALFEQRLEPGLIGVFDVHPQPLVAAGVPGVDELRAALAKRVSGEDRGANDGHRRRSLLARRRAKRPGALLRARSTWGVTTTWGDPRPAPFATTTV